MAKLSSEAKVGLLVLIGSIILLFMTFSVGKFQFGQRGYTISAVFTSVAGLDEKAAVRMAGVKIGQVEKVELTDSKAKIIMRINPDVKIPRGSEAAVKTMGLLGERFVEIIPPKVPAYGSSSPANTSRNAAYPQEVAYGLASSNTSRDNRYLQNGEQITVTVSPSDVDHLIGQLSAISDDIKQVTASLRQALGTEQGARSLQDIVADLRSTMANIQDFSQTLRNNGGELVVRLNELVANLDGIVNENRDDLRTTMQNVREASKNAELALASIDNMTKRIEQGEGTLGKLITDDSVYNNIDTAAKGLSDYTSHLERLRTIVGFRTEYMFPDVKGYFTLELKPRPDKSYILELNNDPLGKFRWNTTVLPDGSTVTERSYSDSFKLSIMYAKRWGNIRLRGGLIESTGGFGFDYYLFGDALTISGEAFNFSSKELGNEKAHVKASVAYNFKKYFFLNAGYDNFLNPERKTPFVGVGVMFDDEDLKYLLGSVPVR